MKTREQSFTSIGIYNLYSYTNSIQNDFPKKKNKKNTNYSKHYKFDC